MLKWGHLKDAGLCKKCMIKKRNCDTAKLSKWLCFAKGSHFDVFGIIQLKQLLVKVKV